MQSLKLDWSGSLKKIMRVYAQWKSSYDKIAQCRHANRIYKRPKHNFLFLGKDLLKYSQEEYSSNRRIYFHILKSIILIWKMLLLSAVLLKLFVNLHNAWNDFGVCCNMILVKFEVILIEFVCSKFLQSFYQ